MPEGHALHRIARAHRRVFVGCPLRVTSPQGRFRAGARRINGCVLEEVDAHGKHVFYRWANDRILHVHLGLYGQFRDWNGPAAAPRGQVRLRVVADGAGFDLVGPNRCELITAAARDAIRDRLGPDPLRRDADPGLAWQRISASRAPIGTLLLDQSVLAGVGNVFRAEVLFFLGLHPETPGNAISRSQFDRLWNQVTDWLRIGVKYGRIITADARELGTTPGRIPVDERLMVYQRGTCRRCEAPVADWKLAGRTIYACPVCQPERAIC